MSDSALEAIDHGRYLAILGALVPDASGILLQNGSGRVVAAQGAGVEAGAPPAGRQVFEIRDQDALVGCVIVDPPRTADGVDIERMRRDVQPVVDCLAMELRLVAELNAMASELAGRYEELNLVYVSNDESRDQDDEASALQALVENCVEFLDTGLVVLFYGKDHVYRAGTGGVEQADELNACLARGLVPWIESTGETLVINLADDPQRARICPKLGYKLLACPVTNPLGAVVGVLVSLKRPDATDFFNSDRNLLEAMARKVAKIDQTNYDALTGLMKRQRFENRLKPVLREAHDRAESHCVLQMDLEQLQVINDLHGREAGDALINRVARSIRSSLRDGDIVSYFGRGKYGVLVRNIDEDQGYATAEQLRMALTEQGFDWQGRPVQVILSVGMTVMDGQSRSVTCVLEAAELAVSMAREKGGNRTRLYRTNDLEFRSRKEEMRYVNRIQEALRSDLFHLYCQPIKACTGDEPPVHCEVLLRLQAEDGRLLSPGLFLPAAERYYLMPMVDRWVIDRTFDAVSRHRLAKRFASGLISINLSGQSLGEDDLAGYIDERLHHYGLPAAWFCFEITETTALGSLHAARDVVAGLRSRGFRFSLDDFGTGLSSFSYLKEFPVDYLKIDGSFVRGVLTDEVSRAMVESINQIGHIMHLKTIAEFVENGDLAVCLESIGVDFLQGYGISEPLPFENYIRCVLAGGLVESA